jgi:hypothetical protein
MVAYDADLAGGSYTSHFTFGNVTDREVACGVILAAAAGVFVPDPDITGDGFVDMADFSMLSAQWQNACGSPSWCDGADINHSGVVNIDDLIIMAMNWLD